MPALGKSFLLPPAGSLFFKKAALSLEKPALA
jgi:hypothetical protein